MKAHVGASALSVAAEAIRPSCSCTTSRLPCPYLSEQTARLPLRLPLARLSRKQLDARLDQGERRQGRLVYRAQCTSCNACEAIRIPVAAYQPSKTQRRIFRRGQQRDRHRARAGRRGRAPRGALQQAQVPARAAATTAARSSAAGYATVLADSCCETLRAALPRGRRADRRGDRRSRRAVAVGGVLLLRPRLRRAQPRRVLDPVSARAVPALGPLVSVPRPDDRGLQGDGVQAHVPAARAADRRSLAARSSADAQSARRARANEACRVEPCLWSRWPARAVRAARPGAEVQGHAQGARARGHRALEGQGQGQAQDKRKDKPKDEKPSNRASRQARARPTRHAAEPTRRTRPAGPPNRRPLPLPRQLVATRADPAAAHCASPPRTGPSCRCASSARICARYHRRRRLPRLGSAAVRRGRASTSASYFTWNIDVKAKLFRLLDLRRGYYESNGVSAPRTEEAAVAAQIGTFVPKAVWLLGVARRADQQGWEPQIRYETRAFETRAPPDTRRVPASIATRPRMPKRTVRAARWASSRSSPASRRFVAGVRYDHVEERVARGHRPAREVPAAVLRHRLDAVPQAVSAQHRRLHAGRSTCSTRAFAARASRFGDRVRRRHRQLLRRDRRRSSGSARSR